MKTIKRTIWAVLTFTIIVSVTVWAASDCTQSATYRVYGGLYASTQLNSIDFNEHPTTQMILAGGFTTDWQDAVTQAS